MVLEKYGSMGTVEYSFSDNTELQDMVGDLADDLSGLSDSDSEDNQDDAVDDNQERRLILLV